MAGFVVVGRVLLMGTYQKTSSGRVLIEAGRRVDAIHATSPRFPASEVAEVRRKAQELFNQEKPLAVVCSAACGADLIVLDVAESMGVERYVLLPSKPTEFRRSSVVDRPGDWGEIYDRVLKTSRVEVLKVPEGQQGYLETNLRLLDQGQALARRHSASAEALVVWNKETRGADDITGHFLAQAKLRKIPVIEIATLREANGLLGLVVGR
jgi:hypothetical protein